MKKLVEKIQELKKQRNAVILAHSYQSAEVQDVADFVGDSLGLSVEASKVEAEVIVFCGVSFMAETAAILSPDKTVLLPDKHAGCPMADMISGQELRELKAKHPGAIVVCYVNSSAEVKAESDYCCTSANAVDVVKSLPAGKEIIFVPDRHLGQFVAEKLGREFILWPGYCPTHALITTDDILQARAEHPGAVVMAHPECQKGVRDIVDEVLSTGGMLKCAKENPATEFVVATEVGLVHTLKTRNPGKEFYPVCKRAVCPNMKRITLEKVVWALEDMKYEVSVPEDISARAKSALDKMIKILPSR